MRDPSVIMVKDSVPLMRVARTHYVRDERRWRRLVRVAPRLRVNLARQQLNAAHRQSLWATRRRANTRLARTAGGKSRWRINVACGRPVRSQMTRAQMEVARSLSLSKHLVCFHWAGESGTVEEAEDGGEGEDDGEERMEGGDQEVEEGGGANDVGDVAVDEEVGVGSEVDLFSVLEEPIGKCNCHII